MLRKDVFKTWIILGNNKQLTSCDTILFEGGVWLVPEWLEAIDGSMRKPERIVRVDIYPELQGNPFQGWTLNRPIDASIWSGDLPPELGAEYIIRLQPEGLEYEVPKLH